jgi:glucose/arabinose dehydrogenase
VAGVVVGVLVTVATVSPSSAATLPTGFSETSVGGLNRPTAMAVAPDGRVFVAEQGGALRVVKAGALLPTPFVSLSVDATGERGLIGVAFDPAFTGNGFVYVHYTTSSAPVHNRVSRFTAAGDVAVPGSEVVLVDLDPLSTATNHNGGAIHFGPDGKLYVAVGDNANGVNAQTLSNRLGKLLRINADGTIPADNPFFGTATGANRAIWALGLRNPFTFAFQPGTGRLFVNDVGASTWEEIDEGFAGANYGWPVTEGPTNDPAFVSPLFAYGHGATSTTGCAIAGGAFYDPPARRFPVAYWGTYVFADLCSGWIRRLDPATATATGFVSGINQPVDLQVTDDGDLLYLARNGGGATAGALRRITYTPSVAGSPVNVHVRDGTLVGPGAAALAADDGTAMTVDAVAGAPARVDWLATFTGVPNDITALQVSIRTSADRRCAQRVALFDWERSRWDVLDARRAPSSEVAITGLTGGEVPGAYVSGSTGSGTVRVRLTCTHAEPFTTTTDLLGVRFTP